MKNSPTTKRTFTNIDEYITGFPKDIQEIIDKLNDEWFEKQVKLWNQMDDEGREFAVKAGQKITMASPQQEAEMRERMNPILDAYVKSMKQKGFPGEEALRWCLDYLKTAPID